MPATDLALLIDASLAGGQIAMSYWRRDPETRAKPDGSPVSEADLAVDGALRAALLHARPDYGWLSEEAEDDLARMDRERCFILDPIDGTRAYLEGHETWAVSLAVAEAGRLTAGVIHMPAKGLTYTAALGQGAALNGTPITVTRQDEVSGARMITSKATYAERNWRGAVPDFARHYRPSMAYRLAVVAQGRFDVMATFRQAWEWDIAAGALIAAEAGALVTDRHGEPLSFNSAERCSTGVLAANPALHAEILSVMA
ncbi:3'(2'),5'-bisphosphate nucleotidase CysQ [Palleronia sp. LCG004]|uniref:3'(2'),5'-bisphosphate nucleotidase CysQ n=1 Tax=Palleronia sp. LCG004 TaxID=3079304 RepID=UPI002941E3E8|nr:3'(2'),5'-bisphosphate nucleotidase CysQ [Palleronia sp. LCG004]WOI56150.1 3'(2'),5'-bisphosphate nucleotidase CysQ [Palleronia sp. LCG004]